MKKTIQGMLGGALVLASATPALANVPGGGYDLAYGAYDIFFKKE